jgi:hypothetical protein
MAYIGLGLNFEVVFGVGFLVDFCDILDFVVLTHHRFPLIEIFGKAKIWGPL